MGVRKAGPEIVEHGRSQQPALTPESEPSYVAMKILSELAGSVLLDGPTEVFIKVTTVALVNVYICDVSFAYPSCA